MCSCLMCPTWLQHLHIFICVHVSPLRRRVPSAAGWLQRWSLCEVSQSKANANMLGVCWGTTPITISINLNLGQGLGGCFIIHILTSLSVLKLSRTSCRGWQMHRSLAGFERWVVRLNSRVSFMSQSQLIVVTCGKLNYNYNCKDFERWITRKLSFNWLKAHLFLLSVKLPHYLENKETLH